MKKVSKRGCHNRFDAKGGWYRIWHYEKRFLDQKREAIDPSKQAEGNPQGIEQGGRLGGKE